MTADVPEDRVAGRAVPLPEEQRPEPHAAVDRRDAAEEILRDSEERMAAATRGDAPGDAADEHRRSAETVDP